MPEVILRKWSKSDVKPLVLLANNINIWNSVRDFFPHPYTKSDANNWVKARLSDNDDLHYVIEVDGMFAGAISILPKEDIYRYTAEIGYWLGEPFWGKGITTKAIELILEICRQSHPEIIRIYAEVFASNKASMRTLEKNGFTLESIRKNAIVKNGIVGDDYVWVKIFEQS